MTKIYEDWMFVLTVGGNRAVIRVSSIIGIFESKYDGTVKVRTSDGLLTELDPYHTIEDIMMQITHKNRAAAVALFPDREAP